MSPSRGFRPYVSVARRQEKALKQMNRLKKNGMVILPVEIQGRQITRTFWGKAWCCHLESFSDYANRLPRGRAYVRNGSVCHLGITKGKITAMVSGTRLYKVDITIKELSEEKWTNVKAQCSGQIDSILELLQGKLSKQVMTVVTDRSLGIFPQPAEIDLNCNCPDWAVMCKHVAAVLYGAGSRLDSQPELLFLLRGVSHQELIGTDIAVSTTQKRGGKSKRIVDSDLGQVFGIDLEVCEAEVSVEAEAETETETKIGKERKQSKYSERRTKTRLKDWPPTARSVKDLREYFNMTQIEFARLLGVAPSTISHWENHKGELKPKYYAGMALREAVKLTDKKAQKLLEQGGTLSKIPTRLKDRG